MKLATMKDGSRNKRLAVVKRDPTRAQTLPEIAPMVQAPFLGDGERVRIEMFGTDGASISGAIQQTVERRA